MINEPLKDGNEDQLAAAIEALKPKTLDDIIRKNREVVQLHLANDADISKLQADILETHPLYALDNWNLIAFDRPGVATTVRFDR